MNPSPDGSRPLPLHPFRPRLADSLRGYDRHALGSDIAAGLTVGVVALPLAMAFAIASGVKPEQGIFTAIIAGFLISALGGSSVQIGGPAGAFIVIVYGIVERYGFANLLVSTVLAGVLLFTLGWLRLGGLVRYVPLPIVLGFTNGIAVLIALSQVKDLLGLQIEKMPGDFFAQLHALASHLGSFNPHALALGAACVVGLAVWPRLFGAGSVIPEAMLEGRTMRTFARVPAPIVALVTLSAATALLQLPVETIGSRFGGIPQALPAFVWPGLSWDGAKQLFIPTLTIAMLGAVESLLCARIADNLTELPRHDPNQELMAQGIANVVVPFFGGIPATGTIARTVTNVRAGAKSPIAGMVHALTLLVIVLAAAPLASSVPLAALAGILLFVAWNMGEWKAFLHLRHHRLPYRVVMVSTFLLTVIVDLTVAVEVGLTLACLFFIYRMSTLFRLEEDRSLHLPPGVRVYRMFGPLFFGATDKIEDLAAHVPEDTRTVVLEAHRLISIDSSGLDAMRQLARTLEKRGIRLVLCHLNEQPLSLIERSGFDDALGPRGIVTHLADALHDVTPQAAAPAG